MPTTAPELNFQMRIRYSPSSSTPASGASAAEASKNSIRLRTSADGVSERPLNASSVIGSGAIRNPLDPNK